MKRFIILVVVILLCHGGSASLVSSIASALFSVATEVKTIESETVTLFEDLVSNATSSIESLKSSLTSIVSTSLASLNITSFLLNNTADLSEDGKLDFEGLAQKYLPNNTIEAFDVVTEDTYILKMFHIQGNSSKVVLLLPGTFCSTDDYLTRGNTSLIYSLIQSGCDVWALNFRGTRYSRRHETLDPDTDALYWDFSADELAYYDIAAGIDFALNKTGQTQLNAVGHAEGVATFMMLTSTRQEYNNKTNLFVALAPTIYFENCGLVWRLTRKMGPLINGLLETLGVNEIIGYNSTIRQAIETFCTIDTVGYDVCVKGLVDVTFGYNPNNTKESFWKTEWGHFLAGKGRKNFIHLLQLPSTGNVRKYDYGAKVNYKMYGSVEPPAYYLQNVTCKVALFIGQNDYLVGQPDAERVKSELGNLVSYVPISDPNFTHQDFIWGENTHEVLYPNVTAIIDLYN